MSHNSPNDHELGVLNARLALAKSRAAIARPAQLGRSRCAPRASRGRNSLPDGELHAHDGAVLGARLDLHRTAVKCGDFPHERKPQPNAAVFPAAGRIDAEERLEDTLLELLGNPRAAVLDPQDNAPTLLAGGDANRRVGSTVTNCVLDQVEHEPIYQRVAANQLGIPATLKVDAARLGEGCKIGENLLDHRR